jgi:hypothetical protein
MHLRHLILKVVPIVYSVDIKHLLYVPFNHLNRGVTSSRRLYHQSPDFKSGGYQLCCERLLCTSGMGGKTRTCEPPDPKSGVLPTELHPYDGTLTKRPESFIQFSRYDCIVSYFRRRVNYFLFSSFRNFRVVRPTDCIIPQTNFDVNT